MQIHNTPSVRKPHRMIDVFRVLQLWYFRGEYMLFKSYRNIPQRIF
jgi:hypothetical protein